ncbi:MAG: efflux RND transporter periplasmic adaptor subunit [Gammaproteobacteria bacterium]|nr:MAG: efflux RND transporter periplasmic adaptor subunit [Gammaproteobacteria bacterium]
MRLLPNLVLVVILVAITWTSNPVLAASPLVVTGYATQGNIIDEIPVSGTVTSSSVAKLSTEVSGLVSTINIDDGDKVNAGDILLTLDTEIEELSLQAAKAATEKSGEELADAKRRLEDAQRLAKQKTISDNELKSLQAEVNIASAELQRYIAEQQLQQKRLEKHQIRAPFSGVISQKHAERGEWIKPGDPIARLVGNQDLRIDFQVPQTAFPKVSPSSEVRVKLDALPGQALESKIQAIVPVSDTDARTFLMRVKLITPNSAMIPGMSVSGVLRLATGAQGVVISRDAILRYPDGRITVWVVNEKNGVLTVSERQVRTGLGFNGQIAIMHGLKAGERVVLEGNESLKDGQTVTIHDTK